MKKFILLLLATVGTVQAMEHPIENSQSKSPSTPLSINLNDHPMFGNRPLRRAKLALQLEALLAQASVCQVWQPELIKNIEDKLFCVITHDKQLLICGDQDGVLYIYSCEDFNLVSSFSTGLTNIWYLDVSPDNKYLLLTESRQASKQKTVFIFDISNVKSPEFYRVLDAHTDWVRYAKVINDKVITCSHDKTLRLWNLEAMQHTLFSDPDTTAAIEATHHTLGMVRNLFVLQEIQTIPDQNLFFASFQKTGLYLFAITPNNRLEFKQTLGKEELLTGIFTYNNSLYFATKVAYNLFIYSLENDAASMIATCEHTGKVICYKFLPDHNGLVVSTEAGVTFWDITTISKPERHASSDFKYYDSRVFNFAVKDSILLGGSEDGTLYCWNIENLAEPVLINKLSTQNSKPAGILDLKILSNNRLLSYSQDGSIKIWQLPV